MTLLIRVYDAICIKVIHHNLQINNAILLFFPSRTLILFNFKNKDKDVTCYGVISLTWHSKQIEYVTISCDHRRSKSSSPLTLGYPSRFLARLHRVDQIFLQLYLPLKHNTIIMFDNRDIFLVHKGSLLARKNI